MKHIMYILSFSLIFCHLSYAQDDPLAESYIIQIGGGKEIAAIDYNANISIYKYFHDTNMFAHDTLIKSLSYHLPVTDYIQFTDFICDDFDHDGLAEIAASWSNPADQANWVLLKPDQALLGIDSLARWEKINLQSVTGPPVVFLDRWELLYPVLIQSGNFDNDEQREIVLAYWAQKGIGQYYVRILLYDVSDSLEVTFLGEIMDQEITVPPEIELCEDQLQLFDIECADLNGDQIDEIILAGRNGSGADGWEIFANIYSWDTLATELVRDSHAALFSRTDHVYDIQYFNMATGNLFSAEKASGVLGFSLYHPLPWDPPFIDTVSYVLIPFEADESLQNITAGEAVYQWQDTMGSACRGRLGTLICEDVNNDGLDEIISSFEIRESKTFQILQGAGPLVLAGWADLDELNDYVSTISVGDIRIDTTGAIPFKELVIPSYPASHLYQIQYDESGNFLNLELLDEMSLIDAYNKTEPILTADFDMDIQLGKPARYSLTQILQPLVILNAPPIHFDVLNDTSYDVSLSYNDNQGQFISHYAKVSSQSTEVSSEFTQDWGTSQTLKAGGSYWGVSVSSYLTTKYGKQFKTSGGHSTTVTVSIGVDAIEDDRIYATVMDYDLWEYPVYGNYELRGHVLVVRPMVTENRWFPSKSWSGYSYIPTHEVGNILSYREYPLLTDNPEVDEKIKGDYNNSFVLDANSSYDWALQFDDFATNQASTSKSYSREWGVDVDVWGSGYSLSSSYSRNEIYTHKTDVSSGLNLSVHLDGIDMGLGEVSYIVTPYTYWATNGALVLDYAVKPELAPQGGTPTWWQVNYGSLADPAFILPWRLDPEKGFALEDEVKRQQTKDLVFLPSDPKNGDTILIRARVHNFGLLPTPGVMSVKFYVGDPDNGGTPILGIHGEEQVYTETSIPARGSQLVEMKWQIPPELPSYPRIYAVIDEDDILPEVHENNNKSWAILQRSTSTPVSNETGIVNNFMLKQNYPNPFNPGTTINYQNPTYNHVTLKVFDMLGREVVTLVNRVEEPGYKSVKFDASKLPSGVYFYRLQAGTFSETKKLLLLR